MKNFQLPLSHPDYAYPDARNIYSDRLKDFPNKVFSDSETEKFTGKWREQFPSTSLSEKKSLQVEIGCNTGHVVRAWAKKNPDILYIGIDWKFKAIHHGLEKMKKEGLENLIFLRANTWRFQYIFGPEELDRISVFCPDPWPKKSQWKNRHLQTETLEVFRSRLKPGGILHIKTDHEGYFDWILEHLAPNRSKWIVENETRDLHQHHPDPRSLDIPDVTLFEKLFIKDGIPIKQIILRKPE
jgi:tRNA (guanine-N7-)-methyltransferase